MIEANTSEWYAARLGKVTASRIADVIAKTKSGWGASRANYKAELIAERLTGVPMESYKSAAMIWGSEHEAEAILSYVFYTDAIVIPAGFIEHPSIAWSGATPDGYAGSDGLIEVKCANTNTHIETLLGQNIPGKYVAQMQWQMCCTERAWCDYVSYDPRLPEVMRLFVKRLYRDDEMIAALEKEVIAFLAEIDETLAHLGKLYALPNMPAVPTLTEQLEESVRLAEVLRAG